MAEFKEGKTIPTPFLPREKLNFHKEAFYAWLESGTCSKARRVLSRKGIVNPTTGKPYSYMAVYLGSYTYLLDNHKRLKPILFDLWGLRENVDMTDEEWEAYLVRKAKMVLGNSSKRRFMEWLEDNPWAEKYDYIYAERFGLRAENSENV